MYFQWSDLHLRCRLAGDGCSSYIISVTCQQNDTALLTSNGKVVFTLHALFKALSFTFPMLLLMLSHRGDDFLLKQSSSVEWCRNVEPYGLLILVSFSTFENIHLLT